LIAADIHIPHEQQVQYEQQLESLFGLIPLISRVANHRTVHISSTSVSDKQTSGGAERQASSDMQSSSGSGSGSDTKITDTQWKKIDGIHNIWPWRPTYRTQTEAEQVKIAYLKQNSSLSKNSLVQPDARFAKKVIGRVASVSGVVKSRIRGVLTNFDDNV
jgi:hypothetical protein